VPAVERAGLASEVFITSGAERVVTVDDPVVDTSVRLALRSDEVSPGFFTAVGTPLVGGREFSEQDGAGGPVAVINDAMARRLWPGAEAVGRRFKPGAPTSAAPWFTVIGVVADMRRQGPEQEPIAQMFEPLAQNPPRLATLLVRTRTDDPLDAAAAVQEAVRGVNPQVPLYGLSSLQARLDTFLMPRRFQTALVIAFAAVTVLIAMVGIYGLIQYSVETRTREIGIRVAVGAQAPAIFAMVLGEGLRLGLAGVALGVAAAAVIAPIGRSLLFGVTTTDTVTFTVVPSVLLLVAMLACSVPARRAMTLDPVRALRGD
jgi:putative ABC transport system permease protein